MPVTERRGGALSSIPGTAEALATDVHGVLSALPSFPYETAGATAY
jgi:hypothetical protein